MALTLTMLRIPDEQRDAVLLTALVRLASIRGGDDIAEVMRLAYTDRRTQAEIAERLGISQQMVSLKLRRANRELRRVLEPHGIKLPWDQRTRRQRPTTSASRSPAPTCAGSS